MGQDPQKIYILLSAVASYQQMLSCVFLVASSVLCFFSCFSLIFFSFVLCTPVFVCEVWIKRKQKKKSRGFRGIMKEAGVERVVTCVHFLSSSERVIKMHMFYKNKQKTSKQANTQCKQTNSIGSSINNNVINNTKPHAYTH